jgi:glycosyltransferase involved in cell wall biosynthesis
LPRAAALAITSKTEGLPMVLLEAMRAGVPVISTAVGGMPDALGDPPCGRLLETRQAEEIAGALAETLRGGESVAAMTARARARFEAQFTSATMADSYQRMYLAASRPEAGDHDAA